jgi:nucleotide-binding universal stress UspA family protein
MKATASPRSRSSSQIVVTAGNRKATAPASAMVPKQLKISKILVPVDFSEFSRKALKYALRMAAQFGAEVTLVHVVEPFIYPTDWMLPLPQTDFAGARRAIIEQLRALTESYPFAAQPIVVEGKPSQEIIKIAKARKADLIIIGTHGYSGVKHALIGSVAERVVRLAPCPVLTVRPDERDFA